MLSFSVDERIFFSKRRLTEIISKTNMHDKCRRFFSTISLTGNRNSKYSGRGSLFTEHREYQQGDDVRFIDWKLMGRTDLPYVKVFSEERKAKLCIYLDQRSSMFFSSQKVMKSVIAAEISAYIAFWALESDMDVSLNFLSSNQAYINRATNSLDELLIQFEELVKVNSALSPLSVDKLAFDTILDLESSYTANRNICIAISDWVSFNDELALKLKNINQFNDLLLINVRDPFDYHIPENLIDEDVAISDGTQEHEVTSMIDIMEINKHLQQSEKKFSNFISGNNIECINFNTRDNYKKKIRNIMELK